MKILLDECLDQHLRHHLPGHDAFSVAYMGWSGTKNGKLLRLAADNGFECFLTIDRGLAAQQNLTALPLPILCLEAASSDLDDLLPLVPALLQQLASPSRHPVTRISLKPLDNA